VVDHRAVVVDVVMGELDRVYERIAGRFTWSEPRARAREYISGLVAGLERKNGWTLAEQAGEVSPDGMQRLLRWADWDISTTCPQVQTFDIAGEVQARVPIPGSEDQETNPREAEIGERAADQSTRPSSEARSASIPNDLVDRARQEDAKHRAVHQRPISADSLRIRLGIGAKRARRLVALVRTETQLHVSGKPTKDEVGSDDSGSAVTFAA
jgi:hypothetical protein